MVLARLIVEHMANTDLSLTPIWNIYFLMDSIPLAHKIFPDRIIMIQALQMLAPFYAGKDHSLALSVVDRLLRLPSKVLPLI